MVKRLEKCNTVHRLAATTLSNDSNHFIESYIIKEEGNVYSPIKKVCLVDKKETTAILKRVAPHQSPRDSRFQYKTSNQDSQPLQESDETIALIQQSTRKNRCCKCCKIF